MSPEHYILDGKTPVTCKDVLTWARWFEKNNKRRRVACTRMWPNVLVSTVFLGLDHNFGDSGLPLLFETMVFGGALDGEQERYSTWDEALSGHYKIVWAVAKAQIRGLFGKTRQE